MTSTPAAFRPPMERTAAMNWSSSSGSSASCLATSSVFCSWLRSFATLAAESCQRPSHFAARMSMIWLGSESVTMTRPAARSMSVPRRCVSISFSTCSSFMTGRVGLTIWWRRPACSFHAFLAQLV